MLLLLASLAATDSPASAASTPVHCATVDVLASSRGVDTVLCTDTSGKVSMSSDGGRHFVTVTSQLTAAGTPDLLEDGALSPSYGSDRTIYLRFAQSGLYSSTDGGKTLTLVDPSGGTAVSGAFMSRVDSFAPSLPAASLPVGGPTPSVMLPGSGSKAIYRGLPFSVAGTGRIQEYRFVQVGHGGAGRVLGLGWGPNSDGASGLTAATCNSAMTCPTGFEFPDGAPLGDVAAQPGPSGKVVAVSVDIPLKQPATSPSLWISTDAGHSFTRANLRAGVYTDEHLHGNDDEGIPAVAVLPNRNIVIGLPEGELYVSKDLGKTWSYLGTPGPSFLIGRHALVASTNGTLYLAYSLGFRCSRDGGHRWALHC